MVFQKSVTSTPCFAYIDHRSCLPRDSVYSCSFRCLDRFELTRSAGQACFPKRVTALEELGALHHFSSLIYLRNRGAPFSSVDTPSPSYIHSSSPPSLSSYPHPHPRLFNTPHIDSPFPANHQPTSARSTLQVTSPKSPRYRKQLAILRC